MASGLRLQLEDPDLRRRTKAAFARLCAADAVEAASTGGLVLATDGREIRDQGQTCTLHWDATAEDFAWDAATRVLRLSPAVDERQLALAATMLSQIAALIEHAEDHAQARAALEVQAVTDPLTGLANRRAWDQRLEEIAGRRAPWVGCLALLDVDEFKQINGLHGHPAGDAVLRAIGAALLKNIRAGDLAARLGGDEFGLLLEGLPAARSAAVIERLRAAAGRQASLGLDAPVTLSAGWSEHAGPLDADALYVQAATALQTAKQAGKDRAAGGE